MITGFNHSLQILPLVFQHSFNEIKKYKQIVTVSKNIC